MAMPEDTPAASIPADNPILHGAGLIRLATEIGGYATLTELFEHLPGHLSPLFPFDGVGIVLHDPATDQIRVLLRPVIVRQLDDELRVTAPLVDAFRGKLDG